MPSEKKSEFQETAQTLKDEYLNEMKEYQVGIWITIYNMSETGHKMLWLNLDHTLASPNVWVGRGNLIDIKTSAVKD